MRRLHRPGRLGRVRYRVWQVVLGFRPGLSAGEIAEVRALLNEEQRALFMAMEPRDRRHSADMVRWLREHGRGTDELLVAALLHDVGKGRLRLWERVAFVLVGAVSRGLRERLAARHGAGFRDAFWRLEHHAALGSAMLEACSSARVRWLVARHTDETSPEDEALWWLIAADSAC